MNPVGERLREARLARGLTQEQLARGLATKGFISQVERNQANPSLAKLRLMAERLRLPIAHFTGEASPQQLTYVRKAAELAIKANEPERAVALVEESLPLTTTANERADLQRLLGMAQDALGHLDDALVAHQTAAAISPPDDPDLNAAIYVEIGTVLHEQERFSGAVEAQLRALDWLERSRHPDPALRSRILNNLGRAYYRLGQLTRADRCFQDALFAATDAESLTRIANAHMNLGVSARAVGDLDRAIEHCNRALDLHSRRGQHRLANRVLNNLADAYYAAGRTGEARELQQRCLERAREDHDDFEIGVAAGELARYAVEAGQVEQAIPLARESQRAAARAADHLHQASAVAVEGLAADRLGRPRVADRQFRIALTMLAEREAAGKLAEVCSMYGEVLRRRGQVDRAFAFVRMAAERDFRRLPGLLRRRR